METAGLLEIADLATSRSAVLGRFCFSCGGPPTSGAGEHIIPQWLQTRLQLGNETIHLLNGSTIPYRKLTVPCCAKCNTGYLSRIEIAVQQVIQRGRISSVEDSLAVGRWMSKILIGLLFKESSLKNNRKDPESGPIVGHELIEEWRHNHFILQSARKTTTFSCLHSDLPFTLYHYDITDPEIEPFDLTTNVMGQSVAIRVGPIGLVYVGDGGMQMISSAKGPFDLCGQSLTAIQFSEMSARIHYKAALRVATHLYIIGENEKSVQVTQLRVTPMTRDRIGDEIRVFREWNEDEFDFVLRAIMGQDLVDAIPLGIGDTTLVRADGKLNVGNGSRSKTN